MSSSHLCVCLYNDKFKIYTFIISAIRATRPAHLILFDFIILTLRSVQIWSTIFFGGGAGVFMTVEFASCHPSGA